MQMGLNHNYISVCSWHKATIYISFGRLGT